MEQDEAPGAQRPASPVGGGPEGPPQDPPLVSTAALPSAAQPSTGHASTTQPGAAQPSTGHASPAKPSMGGRRSPPLGVPGWLVAALVYLAAALVMWWHVWSGHPASAMTCGCGDPPSFVWFLAWPVYAIGHWQSLFLGTQAHVPGGINLLDNTSMLGLGLPLAPLTWVFGPIASLNVALTAAPTLTALSAYGAVRRGLRLSWPAAFLAGLLFGFSPFMMRNEAANHLQTSFLALLPLIFWCCYELAVTQRGKWRHWGLGLGLLIAAQFFIGSDLLTITVLTAAFTLGLAALAALSRRGTLTAKLPFAWRGFLLAGVTGGALLAYPLWFALAGPQHIKGPNYFQSAGNGLLRVLLPLGSTPFQQHLWVKQGYLGQLGVAESYLGIPALLILVVALIAVRRPLTKLCAVATVIALWLSLGDASMPLAKGGEPSWLWLPWRAFDHLPVLDKLTPATFSAPATWFVVVAGTLLVDQLLRPRGSADRARAQPDQASLRPGGPAGARLRVPIAQMPSAQVAAAMVVSAALVVPWLLSWPLPFAAKPVEVPSWVTGVAAHLPSSAVVLYYPFPSTYQDQTLLWQAQYGMRYAIVGGRGIVAGRGNTADHGWTPGTPEGTMTALSVPWEPHYPHLRLPSADPAAVSSFRSALRHWGVTNVVMTAGGRNPAYARQWLTTMLGTPPQPEHGAWVWNNVQQLISS